MSVLQERAQRRRRATAFRVVGVAAATAFACWLPFQLDLGDVGLYDRMGLYALVAIGLTLLMGFAGQVSLGQGGFFLIGAYTSGLLTVGLDPDRRLVDPEAGIDPLLAVAAAPFVSAAVALVIGVPLMRLRGHYLAFATLAFALIAWSLLYAQDRFTGGQYGVNVIERLEVFGHELTGAAHAAVVWGIVGLALLLSTNLVASRVGRALQAIAVNEPAAAASGINVALYKLQLFVFAAALAGLAGGLFTFYAQFLGPEDFGIILSLLFVVMVSIGGLGQHLRRRCRRRDDRLRRAQAPRPRHAGDAARLGSPAAGPVDPLARGLRPAPDHDHALLPERPAPGHRGQRPRSLGAASGANASEPQSPSIRAAFSLRISGRTSSLKSASAKSASQRSGVISG